MARITKKEKTIDRNKLDKKPSRHMNQTYFSS